MAATVKLTVNNDDRYFSPNHVPTATEVIEGFVNQELAPKMGILIGMGFNYYGAAPEIVTLFTGEVDAITVSPMSRDATIDHRDATKKLINKIDSTNLQVGKSIDQLIRYVLNRNNISNYEMVLDSNPVIVQYFFTDQQNQLDTIRDLTQAGGDALFYIDELGIARYNNFMRQICSCKNF